MKSDQSSIVAPAMRFVPVSNLKTSVAFYSERLGFLEQELVEDYGMGAAAELLLGTARIQLCPLDSSEKIEPRILFFETDNVSDLHDKLQRRGANPSALQRVNWIKMEMFEVRDPDGNTIWFGQSFHQPDQEQPRAMVQRFLPHLPVDNVPAAVRYYCDVLGFSINYAQDDLGVMYRDKATLLLIQRTEAHTGIGSCSAYIENADQLHAELVGRGANVLGPPVSRPWGLRDFTVADQEGNRITFAQPFE
jgi:catechol 2,3-dioxygenase-like lactoylglutathione lyase family enzyme